jgi:hypothetical protein
MPDDSRHHALRHCLRTVAEQRQFEPAHKNDGTAENVAFLDVRTAAPRDLVEKDDDNER